MAVSTPCQTPGAMYTTHITPAGVTVAVTADLTSLDAADAELLESQLHNVVELVLQRWWHTPEVGG
ncbi:hypothetical protein [Micromonospora carbonacea]|uniref:Uncharacterized protein n=1 Tax=Micromonospora carbonacea TaxID=47853 RepID=A0A1C5AA28_9ACTN|nr:hypothetical protein [Micromonospora carbonacea]SCF41999.1 hypothetical protein GA0070563_11225 [Micromonospora carbonacea]